MRTIFANTLRLHYEPEWSRDAILSVDDGETRTTDLRDKGAALELVVRGDDMRDLILRGAVRIARDEKSAIEALRALHTPELAAEYVRQMSREEAVAAILAGGEAVRELEKARVQQPGQHPAATLTSHPFIAGTASPELCTTCDDAASAPQHADNGTATEADIKRGVVGALMYLRTSELSDRQRQALKVLDAEIARAWEAAART